MAKHTGKNIDPSPDDSLEKARAQLDGGINSVDGVLSRIERTLGKKKTLKDDERTKLSNLEAMIGSLEREVARFGDGLIGQRNAISDLRRRFDGALEQVTGGEPIAKLPEVAPKKEQDGESVKKVTGEFQKELQKILGDYGNLLGDIRKRRVSRADAVEAVMYWEQVRDDVEKNWIVAKAVLEQEELTDRDQAQIALVETQLFQVKTQHERALAEAEKVTDELKPVDEPQQEPVRRGDDAFEAKRANIADEAKKTLESIEVSINQVEAEKAKMTPVQLRNRIEGILGVLDRTGGNWARAKNAFFKPEFGPLNAQWQEVDDLGVKLNERAQALYDALPQESDQEKADRLVRGLVYGRNTWKPEYEGQSNAAGRWSIVEKYVREGMTFAELELYFVNARALEGVTGRLDELAPVYKGMLEARDKERAKERESKRKPMIDEQLIANGDIWKPEVTERARWNALRDFARGELSIEQIVELTLNEEAGAAFFENASRLKEERIQVSERAINDIPNRLQKVTARIESLKAQADGLFKEDVGHVQMDHHELVIEFEKSLRFLTDVQAPASTTSNAAAVHDQLTAVEKEIEALWRRMQPEEASYGEDPAEKELEDIVTNEALWREKSLDVRRDIVRAETEGRLKDRELRRAVKDVAAFRANVVPFIEHLDKRGLLDIVAPRVDLEGMDHEARIVRLEDLVRKQEAAIVHADFWRDGIHEDERLALLAANSIATEDDIIKLKDKTVPYWGRKVQAAARKLVYLRRTLAKQRSMAARALAGEDTAAEQAVMDAEEGTVGGGEVTEARSETAEASAVQEAAVESVRIEPSGDVLLREKAIAEHRPEILTLLSEDFLWEPWFASGNVGSRKAAIAKMLKTGVLPKREHVRDIELFKILSSFRDIEDLRGMILRAKPAEQQTVALQEIGVAPVAAPVPEAAPAPIPPVARVRRPLPVVAAVPAPVEAVVPPRLETVASAPREAAVDAPKSPEVVKSVVAPARAESPRSAVASVEVAPSLRPERYFEQARAKWLTLVDDDDETEGPPMRAAENTSRMATQTIGWFGRVRERLFGKKEVQQVSETAMGPKAQAAGGAIATAGRLFGYSAFFGITDRVAGVSAAERRVLEGAVKRAAVTQAEHRSAESALERREEVNKEAFERLERSIAASSKPQAEKKALQERLKKAREAYASNVAADREARNAEVATAIERATNEVQPSLQARGSAFVRERDARKFTEIFDETMRERKDLNVVARVFEAFRRKFVDEWERQAGARRIPPSEALRGLGDRVGVEPTTGSVDDATLTANVGSEAAARVSQQRIQSDVDALIAALERK